MKEREDGDGGTLILIILIILWFGIRMFLVTEGTGEVLHYVH